MSKVNDKVKVTGSDIGIMCGLVLVAMGIISGLGVGGMLWWAGMTKFTLKGHGDQVGTMAITAFLLFIAGCGVCSIAEECK